MEHSIPSAPRLRSSLAAILLLTVAATASAGDPPSGLTWVETIVRFSFDNSLDGAIDAAASPDGRNLYVASVLSDNMLILRRDPATGALTKFGTVSGGFYDGTAGVAVSPDGDDIYVAAILADRVNHLRRDASNGSVSSGSPVPGPLAGGPLDGATAVAVTPDGSQVWAVGLEDPRLFVYDRGASGALGVPAAFDLGLDGARSIAFDPGGTHAYIANINNDTLLVLERLAGGGATLIQTLTQGVAGLDGLDGAYDIAVTTNAVYVAALHGSTLAHFTRAPSGVLFPAQLFREGQGGVSGLNGSLSVAVTSDGGHVYAAANNPGTVAAFDRAPTGDLTFLTSYAAAGELDPGLVGAAGVTTFADSVYVTALDGRAVAHLRRNRHNGQLDPVETRRDAPPMVAPDAGGGFFVGEDLYFTGFASGTCGGCAHWARLRRDAPTGALTAVSIGDLSPELLPDVDSSALAPSESHAYLASSSDHSVTVAVHHAASGGFFGVQTLIDGVAGVDGLSSVGAIAVSPDGRHVYAAGTGDNLLARFGRASATGLLSFLGTTSGPTAPRELLVSPDGGNLYASADGSRLWAFARDAVSGDLSLVGIAENGIAGVTGMDEPAKLTVSPDGRHLYVAAVGPPAAVVVFARSPATGSLGFLEAQVDGTGTIQGLADPQGLVVTRSGRHLYVAGRDQARIGSFSRDPSSGSLSFLRAERTPHTGPASLVEVRHLLLSPAGGHLYAGGSALAVFATEDVFVDGFESGDTSRWSTATP